MDATIMLHHKLLPFFSLSPFFAFVVPSLPFLFTGPMPLSTFSISSVSLSSPSFSQLYAQNRQMLIFSMYAKQWSLHTTTWCEALQRHGCPVQPSLIIEVELSHECGGR